MKFIKKSKKTKPKVSLILLDWSVRESFHFLYYLEKQTVKKEFFEVVIVEYYSRESNAIKPFEQHVDTWILLEMPTQNYYHKHLMYNVGLIHAKGEIIVICDSDAMVKPSFLQTIITHFEKNPDTVLHLDQFRNHRRDFYPFNYPTFEDVTGAGCINYFEGKTTGFDPKKDLLHHRNYGACFCAKRDDLIAIGGSDEHVDYVGYICGPYDLTLRLINEGKKEVWHEDEFIYHTWHPGEAGTDNYFGPHDGRHFSTTALTYAVTGMTQPHVKNRTLAHLDSNKNEINSEILKITSPSFLKNKELPFYAERQYVTFVYKGFLIEKKAEDLYQARPLVFPFLKQDELRFNNLTLDVLKKKINKKTAHYFLKKWKILFKTSLYQTMQAIKDQRTKAGSDLGVNSKRSFKKEINKKLHQLKQLLCEIKWLSQSYYDLVINLFLLESLKNISIFVYTKKEEEIIQSFFPAAFVKCVHSFYEIHQDKELFLNGNRMIISRTLYVRFLGEFSNYVKRGLAIVV